MSNLFNFSVEGFVLHSGSRSPFLINCEVLTEDDLDALAHYVLPELPPFDRMVSIPRGGVRFGGHMAMHMTKGANRVLLVDDVWTKGTSMREMAEGFAGQEHHGVVIFARTATPDWVTPIFRLLR